MATTKPKVDHAKVVEQEMPGWKIVDPNDVRQTRTGPPSDAPMSDAVSPSLADMQKKYGLGANDDAGHAALADAEAQAKVSTEVVTVESPTGERKTIGISGGKVTWRQG